ncbi:hypothetical protein CEXT_427911, partial [Caerostris extrusa]
MFSISEVINPDFFLSTEVARQTLNSHTLYPSGIKDPRHNYQSCFGLLLLFSHLVMKHLYLESMA